MIARLRRWARVVLQGWAGMLAEHEAMTTAADLGAHHPDDREAS